MLRLIKIELCNETKSGDIILAKEYLSIDDISNYRNEEQYYPTYGPTFIDMYNEPNNYRIKKVGVKSDDDTSYYASLVARGSFYKARLSMSVSSRKISPFSEFKESIKVPNYMRKSYLRSKSVIHDFLVFCVINEVSMIDDRYKNGEMRFQLCIGKHGYDDVSNLSKNITEPTRPLQLMNTMPFYLPFEKLKPCLSLKFAIEDFRFIMFKNNFVSSKLNDFVSIKLY